MTALPACPQGLTAHTGALPAPAGDSLVGVGESIETPAVWRHEVRNALTSVSGYAQLALRRLPADADAQLVQALLAIRDGVDRTWRLVATPLDTARRSQCDLALLVQRALSQVPPTRLPDLRVLLQTEAPLIGRWDGDRVTQVLANLLDNAAKYSRPGSPIDVVLTRLTDQGTGCACVAVRDQGIGIPSEDIDRIFSGYRTPSASAWASGSGIGLPLSRQLAEAEGGRLWALQADEQGTVVYLQLPLAAPPDD
jgi:signal transduction histidine kinase